jgi:hypothetical protein
MKNEKSATMGGKKIDSITGISNRNSLVSHRSNDIKKQSRPTDIHSVSSKNQLANNQPTSRKPLTISNKPILRKIGRNMDIARNNGVTRFASNITNKTISSLKPSQNNQNADIGPIKHPIAKKVDSMRAFSQAKQIQKATPMTPKETKEAAIAEAFMKLDAHKQQESDKLKHSHKLVNTIGIIIGIIFLAFIAYMIYINMPVLSVNIAGAQAGINATFPEYKPDGYNLNGPVSYADGQVMISFKSNDGKSDFAIKQSKSSWDSSAVKNQVTKDSNNHFITTEERGLTIFTYGGNAAWVNGGILYTITGNAPLTGDQIRRIATSL